MKTAAKKTSNHLQNTSHVNYLACKISALSNLIAPVKYLKNTLPSKYLACKNLACKIPCLQNVCLLTSDQSMHIAHNYFIRTTQIHSAYV